VGEVYFDVFVFARGGQCRGERHGEGDAELHRGRWME
jgi:hypothetical protein